MHKRKDYYHAGGDNGNKQGFLWDGKFIEPINLTNVKPDIEPYHSQPPDNKPSLFKRIATYWKGRTEAQKGQ